MMMVMRSQTERRSRHLQGPSSVLRLLYAEKFCCLVAHYSFRNTLPLLKHFPILHYIRLCKGLPCLPCSAPLFALRWTCGAAHVTHSPPTLPRLQLCPLLRFSSDYNFDNSPASLPVDNFFRGSFIAKNVALHITTLSSLGRFSSDYNFDNSPASLPVDTFFQRFIAKNVTHSPPTLPITTLSSLEIFFLSQLRQLSCLWILFSDVCCQNVTLAPPTRTTYNTYYHIFEIYTFVLANIFFLSTSIHQHFQSHLWRLSVLSLSISFQVINYDI